MTPLARVRIAPTAPEGTDTGARRGPRYEEDRAAVAAMLKNYGWLSLLWLLPLSLVLSTVRLVYLTFARRFEEAYDVAAAWGWNVAHLPNTFSRRRRVQKARRAKDRSLRRFMESAGLRSPRWMATAERILEEQRAIDEADEGQPIRRRLRDRTASLVGTHPVIVGSFLAIVVGAVAVRDLVRLDVLAGGALPAFPAHPGICSPSSLPRCVRRRSGARCRPARRSEPSASSPSSPSATPSWRRRRSSSRDRPWPRS